MWWASATKYKQVFVSRTFNQIEYGTEHGVYRTGYLYPTPYPESFLPLEIIHSIPPFKVDTGTTFDARDLTLGTTQLKCFTLSQTFAHDRSVAPLGLFPAYCSALGKPILRLSFEETTNQVTRNQLALFRDEYVAKAIAVTEKTHPATNIMIDEVESLPALDANFFTPPSDAQPAKPLPKFAPVSSRVPGLTGGRFLKGADARFPEGVRGDSARGGTARLEGTVTRNGHLHNLSVLSAPSSAFAIAALQAAITYEFQPFILNGEHVEAKILVDVKFEKY